MNMILTVLITAFGVLIANLAILWLVNRRLQAEKAAFTQTLQLYFDPQGEKRDEPSEFSALVRQISQVIASDTAQSLKSVFLGVQSGEARATKQIEGAIAQDMIGIQSPILGQIMQSFPAAGKLISKNPQLLQVFQQMMAQKTGGAPAQAAESNGGYKNF